MAAVHDRTSSSGASGAEILLQHVTDVVGLVDDDGRWVRVSPSVEAVLGYSPAELVGRPVDEVLLWDAGWITGGAHARNAEVEARGRSGGRHWLEVDVRRIPGDGSVAGYVLTARDVTTRRLRDEELSAKVLRDPLTGLANRAHLETVVTHALQRLRRRDGLVALLFLDLDRFKDVNDRLGHVVGDRVLVEVARRLTEVLRDSDVAARVGGDEFVVCCEDLSDVAEAEMVAERVVRAVGEPIELAPGHVVEVHGSFGIAVASRPVHPGALLADADSAMYRAKRAGDGQVVIVHTDSDSSRGQQPPLEGALRRDELRLAFQPVVRVGDGRVVGAEALLRWQHPQLGLVSPWVLRDAVGSFGLPATVSAWVLDEVCRSLGDDELDDGGSLDVSVNVRMSDLLDARFVSRVVAQAEEHDVDVSRMCFEVRDGPELAGTRARRALATLQDAGVGVMVDGFPGAPSSLSAFQQLRPRAVKFDQSLLIDLEHRAQARDLVGGLASVARSLGTAAVATGVERPEQEAILRPLGVDLAQGNHISPPLLQPHFVERHLRGSGGFVSPSSPPQPAEKVPR